MRSKGPVNSHDHSPSTSGSVPLVNSSKKTVVDKATTIDPIVNKTDSHVNKPINVDLDFSIVDELKQTRSNVSLFELAKIDQFQNEIVNSLLGRTPNLP